MIPEDCKFFEVCNAPICPLDQDKEGAIWYPDEAICKNPEFLKSQYVKTQKKISKIHRKKGVEGVFTLKMLNRNIKVRSGIKGINEESSFEEFDAYENAWIQRHKELSKEFIEKKRAQISEINEGVRP